LLGITSEQKLEQFLGDLVNTVGNAVGSLARSDTGQALGRIHKDAAKQALPVIGRAVGQWISPNGRGAIGANIASQAGRLFGLELEGLSPGDKELEVAWQFVRSAGAAAKQASVAPLWHLQSLQEEQRLQASRVSMHQGFFLVFKMLKPGGASSKGWRVQRETVPPR